MKRLIGILFTTCLVCNINAQILWKVTGNNLDKPSYILGTHHLAPISILDSINGFQKAFDETTQVIGEVVMSDMMTAETMSIMQKYLTMDSDTTLNTLLTPDEFDMVNAYTKENLKLDFEVAFKLKPSFISNTISINMASKAMPDFNPQQQLDMFLQQKAVEQNKSIDGFETIEFQFDILFDGQSLQRQAELLVCMLNDMDKQQENTRRIRDLYMKQNINGLYQLMMEKDGNHCDPLPGEMELILDNRNIRWVEAFPEKVKSGPAFIVVGAGHLPGENGLINLLKQKGYTVQPVS